MKALKVKLLHPDAKVPTIGHSGEDLGFDLYALQTEFIDRERVTMIRTGIAVSMEGFGFFIKDRSSMAASGFITSGGVIDEGYTGEIVVSMTYFGKGLGVSIQKGSRFAQLVPQKRETDALIVLVNELPPSKRGNAGFGSTGA